MLPLLNKGESLVTVWVNESKLVHLTVVLTGTVSEAGLKAEPCIETSLAAGVPPVFGGVGVALSLDLLQETELNNIAESARNKMGLAVNGFFMVIIFKNVYMITYDNKFCFQASVKIC